MSVEGKHILITGATAGIGLAAAKNLAQAGARITLTARNPEKGSQALREISAGSERDDHAVVAMDFASLQSVREGVQRFLSANDRLDILLNNAGVVNTSRKLTADGFEETFAVNHLAPFLLTGLLLPVLLNPGSRIVNVASDAHTFVRGMDFDDLQAESGYRTFGVYGRSKLANMLFTIELAERLNKHSVTCNSLHPGAVSTSLGTQNGGLMSKVLPVCCRPFSRRQSRVPRPRSISARTRISGQSAANILQKVVWRNRSRGQKTAMLPGSCGWLARRSLACTIQSKTPI